MYQFLPFLRAICYSKEQELLILQWQRVLFSDSSPIISAGLFGQNWVNIRFVSSRWRGGPSFCYDTSFPPWIHYANSFNLSRLSEHYLKRFHIVVTLMVGSALIHIWEFRSVPQEVISMRLLWSVELILRMRSDSHTFKMTFEGQQCGESREARHFLEMQNALCHWSVQYRKTVKCKNGYIKRYKGKIFYLFLHNRALSTRSA